MSRKIAFDLWRTGLGNNGGSRTLVKCAKTLAELGCEVRMYSDVANQYTWDHSWKKNVKFMCEKEYPIPQDFIVFATGFWSIKHVLQRRKHINDDIYIYIRGHEKWNTSSEELRGLYGKFPSGHCIVNSGWLFKYLEEYGIKSKLIYPGIDDVFKIKPKIQKENIIGALYSKRHKTKRHQDAKEVSRLSGYPVRMLNKHKKNPSEKQLNKWYNQFKVWFAPTELEGLHLQTKTQMVELV